MRPSKAKVPAAPERPVGPSLIRVSNSFCPYVPVGSGIMDRMDGAATRNKYTAIVASKNAEISSKSSICLEQACKTSTTRQSLNAHAKENATWGAYATDNRAMIAKTETHLYEPVNKPRNEFGLPIQKISSAVAASSQTAAWAYAANANCDS